MGNKTYKVEVLRCKGLKNPIREVCYLKKTGTFRVTAVKQATEKQIRDACRLKLNELCLNEKNVYFELVQATIKSGNELHSETFIIEVIRCEKKGVPIRNVSFVKRTNSFIVTATKEASDSQITDAVTSAVKQRFPNISSPVIRIEASPQKNIEESSTIESNVQEKHRFTYSPESPFRKRILTIGLNIQCPECGNHFRYLCDAIDHAKKSHPTTKHLVVYLYEAAYTAFIKEKGKLCQDGREAQLLLEETEAKIDSIEEKQQMREMRDYLKYEATPNTWEDIKNSTRQSWHWWDPEVRIDYVGRVDSKRSKH